MAEMVPMMPIAVSLGVGAADGWLARQDAMDPTRQLETTKQHSTWLEVAAVGLGLVLNSRARSAKQEGVAEAMIYTGTGLLARRGGVYAAAQQESPKPSGAVLAAAHVFKPMVAGQFAQTAEERTLTRSAASVI